jgi:6-pyruvoyltetrahydropterin/6-carboxytetrahydropterin synthase
MTCGHKFDGITCDLQQDHGGNSHSGVDANGVRRWKHMNTPRFAVSISKEFTFDAAHYLPTVPEDHKCRRMHGHTYRVQIVLHDYVGATGFAGDIDYEDIANAWRGIHEVIDHRTLNDVEGLEVPSTENLALWIMRRLYSDPKIGHALDEIRIAESSTTWCTFSVYDMEAVLMQQGVALRERR